MARENHFLKIALGVFVFLFLGLAVALYFVSTAYKKEFDRATAADQTAKDANTKLSEKTREALDLRTKIGVTDADKLEDITAMFDQDANLALKGKTPPVAPTYRRLVDFLVTNLNAQNDKLDALNKSYATLNANFDNLNALREQINAKHDDEKQAAAKTLASERDNYNKSKQNLDTQVAQLTADKQKIEDDLRSQVTNAEGEKKQALDEKKRAVDASSVLTQELANLKTPLVEHGDGEVIAVSQGRGIVTLNLGSDDGLRVRMVFTVYDSNVLGINLPRAHAGDENDYVCSVCKRQEKLDIAKASIEVTRITGPHSSEARILEDKVSNPIMTGDIVYTPIWKPGQKIHFALEDGLEIPGLGARTGETGVSHGDIKKESLDIVRNLIASNGGEIDAWIDEEGKLQGKVTHETTYVILGDPSKQSPTKEAKDSREEMIKDAGVYAAKTVTLPVLLQMMGYKDVTPVRGFGDRSRDGDHVVSQPTGSNRGSAVGTTSGFYSPDNIPARVDNDDRAKPVSTGKVSSFLSESSPTTSPGSVSDTFRPRKPPAQ
ncbi:MAG: hypothetical protein ACRC46_13215 [Thermoguttaceae bacterium]